MFGREEAEELFGEKLYNDDERGEKKKHWLPKLVIVLVLIAFIAGIVFATVPQARGMLTGEDYVTSTQLKKAVNIENLSSAEFVYNGIAEKHKDNSDEIEYRVAYEATVKVGVKMSDIDFDIDQSNKVIVPRLPEIAVNSVAVDVNSLSYMPKNPDTGMKEVLDLCEADAKNEANNSDKFYRTAEDNMKSVVEALTLPLVKGKGYSIAWVESK